MNKNIVSASLILVIVLVALAWTKASAIETLEVVNTPSGKTISIPAHAIEVLPDVFDLGTQKDPVDGKMVQGYAFVHRKDSAARTTSPKPPATSTCYGYLADGAKWKSVEPWVVNPTNRYGIAASTISNLLTAGINRWEDAVDGIIGNSLGKDIIGEGTVTTAALSADYSNLDNVNEIYFAPLSDPKTIAITITWGIYDGPIEGRDLREWDQVYNTTHEWSAQAGGVAGAMDFANISVHELGHSLGMGDLYTKSCRQETMYGYGSTGEIIKRDLSTGDITGIKRLYQ